MSNAALTLIFKIHDVTATGTVVYQESQVMGRLGKFIKENTLLNQEFIKDSKLNVSQYMKSVDKDLTATGFIRFALG